MAATPPIRRLILHGASVRAAAQSAQRADFDVFGIDIFGDTDARAACGRFKLLPTDRSESGRNSLRKAIDQARLEWPDAMVMSVGDIGGDPLGKNPRMLEPLARAARWHVPPAFTQSTKNNRGRCWLVKSGKSSGGLGVHWLADKTPTQSDAIIQAYVPGRTYGATLIGSGTDCRLIGVCRSHQTRLGSRPFVYAGSSGPERCGDRLEDAVENLGREFVLRSKHRGLFNIDFIVTPDEQRYLLEINARWSASMEIVDWARRSIDKKAPALIADHVVAVKERRLPPAMPLSAVGLVKRIVYADRTGKFSAKRLASLAKGSESRDDAPSWADIPSDHSPIVAGQPLVTLLTTSPRYRQLYRATQLCVIGCT